VNLPHLSYSAKQELTGLLDWLVANSGMRIGAEDSGLAYRLAELEAKVAAQQSEIEAMQELVYQDVR
jgi:putative hemolysin